MPLRMRVLRPSVSSTSSSWQVNQARTRADGRAGQPAIARGSWCSGRRLRTVLLARSSCSRWLPSVPSTFRPISSVAARTPAPAPTRPLKGQTGRVGRPRAPHHGRGTAPAPVSLPMAMASFSRALDASMRALLSSRRWRWSVELRSKSLMVPAKSSSRSLTDEIRFWAAVRGSSASRPGTSAVTPPPWPSAASDVDAQSPSQAAGSPTCTSCTAAGAWPVRRPECCGAPGPFAPAVRHHHPSIARTRAS